MVKHTLEMRNIVKRFPGVLATIMQLDDPRGRNSRLLGENGAGKSTLMRSSTASTRWTPAEILIDANE